jgi:hypothetical protein
VISALRTRWTRLARTLSPVSSFRRLSDTLPAYRNDLELLIQLTDAAAEPWATDALQLLQAAGEAARERNPERGWRLFHATQRLELYGLRAHPEAFRVRANSIRAEALQKLRSWRRAQVEALRPPANPAAEVSDAEFAATREAALLLHEHFANEAVKARVEGIHIRVLIVTALVAAVLWWWTCAAAVLAAGDDLPLDNPCFLGSALLFGVMGAVFSALTSFFTRVASQTIPEQAFSNRVTLARLAVGALSALVVYVALASGLISVGKLNMTPPLLLVVAFAAGFSERLVIRALERVTSSE